MQYTRWQNASVRLKKQLADGTKPIAESRGIKNVPMEEAIPKALPLTPKDKDRIKKEISILEDRLKGIKKPIKRKKKSDGTQATASTERWFIDISSIKYGYVKQAQRRKNKGKSKKKLKRVKQSTFLKSVVAQPGDIQAYREGRKGISPKFHTFKMRKDETFYNYN